MFSFFCWYFFIIARIVESYKRSFFMSSFATRLMSGVYFLMSFMFLVCVWRMILSVFFFIFFWGILSWWIMVILKCGVNLLFGYRFDVVTMSNVIFVVAEIFLFVWMDILLGLKKCNFVYWLVNVMVRVLMYKFSVFGFILVRISVSVSFERFVKMRLDICVFWGWMEICSSFGLSLGWVE